MVPPSREPCFTHFPEPLHHGAGIPRSPMTHLIPELFLPQLQVLMDLIPISQVVGDGSVHFLQAQSGIELVDGFRGVALLEGDHDRVERNAQRTHPQPTPGNPPPRTSSMRSCVPPNPDSRTLRPIQRSFYYPGRRNKGGVPNPKRRARDPVRFPR